MAKNSKPDLDLQDSEDDKRHLRDTTASSAGEEGDSVFDNAQNLENPSDVTSSERALLRKSATQNPNDESEEDVRESALDAADNEGAPLNEGNLESDRFGEDLDLPESEEVDEEE